MLLLKIEKGKSPLFPFLANMTGPRARRLEAPKWDGGSQSEQNLWLKKPNLNGMFAVWCLWRIFALGIKQKSCTRHRERERLRIQNGKQRNIYCRDEYYKPENRSSQDNQINSCSALTRTWRPWQKKKLSSHLISSHWERDRKQQPLQLIRMALLSCEWTKIRELIYASLSSSSFVNQCLLIKTWW